MIKAVSWLQVSSHNEADSLIEAALLIEAASNILAALWIKAASQIENTLTDQGSFFLMY